MTSPSTAIESCAKSLCSAPAAFLLQFDYGAKVVWLADLVPGYEPSNVTLCVRHAERFSAPIGWELVDRSSSAPPLFVQETPSAVRADGPASDAGSDGAETTGTVVSRPDLHWELRDKSRRHPSVRGGVEPGSRDGIRIRRVRRDDPSDVAPVPAPAAHEEEHPSGPLHIHDRDELPHVAREIERIARELATESPARFGPGSAFDITPEPSGATQMPLLGDDDGDLFDVEPGVGGEFGEEFGTALPADEAFGESLPFEYDQTVVIDRYDVPGPMFLGDEDSRLRPSSGSLPF